MGAGKNKSHRKKRISKHVLQAEERRKIADVEKKLVDGAAAADAAAEKKKEKNGSGVIAADDPDDSTSPKTMASNASTEPLASSSSSSSPAVVVAVKKTKDPEEASSYLSLWKYDRSTTNKDKNKNKQWKFNKNTQSWLLRHMYNPTKVSKHTFALLLEYLRNGENDGVQNRVLEEAKFRARRYKEFEKQIQQQHQSKLLQENGCVEKVVVQSKEKNAQDDDTNNKEEEEEERTEQSSVSKQVAVVDSTSWKEMDEHEKRKEYKRARKVLDAFKEATVVVRDGDV